MTTLDHAAGYMLRDLRCEGKARLLKCARISICFDCIVKEMVDLGGAREAPWVVRITNRVGGV